jgi:hypothetical protein
LVTTMKNRRNEISGHLQQSCTLKLNTGVPLLVATMLHFVAKIYKLVHACLLRNKGNHFFNLLTNYSTKTRCGRVSRTHGAW